MRLLLILAAAFLSGNPLHAQSVRYFLKFEGGTPAVTGTSTTEGYQNQIEVVSWGFSGENPVTFSGPTGTTSGRFSAESGLECIMQVDPKALPAIMQNMASGQYFTKVLLTGVRFNGSQPSTKFQEVDLRLVLCSQFNQSGTNGDAPICNMRLNFGAIGINTWVTNPNGTTTAVTPPFQWSIIKNNATLNVE